MGQRLYDLFRSKKCRYVAVSVAGGMALIVGLIAIVPPTHQQNSSTSPREIGALTGRTSVDDQPDPNNDGLAVALADLDFGDVGETRHFSWQFNILNPTDQAIRIDDWQSFCSQRIENRIVTVPAHGEAVVHVELDLTPRDPSDMTAVVEQRRRIAPIIRGRRKRGWTLYGRSHRAFAVSTPIFKFDNASDARPGQFIITMLRPDVTVDVECEPSVATMAIERHIGEPRETYSVGVAPRANPAGLSSFPIQIRSSQFDGMSASNSIWAIVK